MELKNQNIKRKRNYILFAVTIILFVMIILALFLMGKFIDNKRSKWETDRNFYGNSMKLEQMKIKKNLLGVTVYQTKDFKKLKVNGKILYYIDTDSGKENISESDYKKYVDNADEVQMYQKKCMISFSEDNKTMEAVIASSQHSFTPDTFSKEELGDVKKAVWEQCKNKIFIYERPENLEQNKKMKDWKGRKVCTDFTFRDKKRNIYGEVEGKSLIPSDGKYDRLYPDTDMYMPDNSHYDLKDMIMFFAAKLYYFSKTLGNKWVYVMVYAMLVFFLEFRVLPSLCR